MRILIAGGGIGGLTASIGLARLGHDVQVLEQASKLRPVGAGIGLQPNAMQALSFFGLDEAVAARGRAATGASLKYSDGKPVRSFDFAQHAARYGYLPLTIHRAALLDVLLAAATKEKVNVRFAQRIRSFTNARDGVAVTTEAGHSFMAQALVGADGINSRVRAQLWGKRPKRYSGYVCWRGIVTDPDLVAAVENIHEVWGRGARFGYMRCSESQVYWFATKTTAHSESQPEDWRSNFHGWPDPIPRLIESGPADRIAFNDISDHKPIFPWAKGRVTLLGDAAHAMTPNFGQGGAQAIEDAVILSRAVEKLGDLESAFRSYEKYRHPRTKGFVNASRSFGAITQGGSAFTRFVRRRILRLIPESSMQKKLDAQFDFRKHASTFNARIDGQNV